jgi:hypothetical protein
MSDEQFAKDRAAADRPRGQGENRLRTHRARSTNHAWLLASAWFFAPLALAAQTERSPSLFALIVTWLPIIVIFGLWILVMKRLGLGRQRALQDRSLQHMDRLEAQSQEMLETLRRIEAALRERG